MRRSAAASARARHPKNIDPAGMGCNRRRRDPVLANPCHSFNSLIDCLFFVKRPLDGPPPLNYLMAMPWPSTVHLTTEHLDSGTANPGMARNALQATVQAARAIAESRATQAEAEEGIVADKLMTPQRTKQAIDALAKPLIWKGRLINSGRAGDSQLVGTWEELFAMQGFLLKIDFHLLNSQPPGTSQDYYPQGRAAYNAYEGIAYWLPSAQAKTEINGNESYSNYIAACFVGNGGAPSGASGVIWAGVNLNRTRPAGSQVTLHMLNHSIPKITAPIQATLHYIP